MYKRQGAIVIDSGSPQSTVLRAVEYLAYPRNAIICIKGYASASSPDVTRPTMVQLDGRRHKQYRLGTNGLKVDALRRLKAGRITLHTRISDGVIAELTAEKLVLVGGKHTFKKINQRQPNEAFDEVVYALGCIRTCPPDWAGFAAAVQHDEAPPPEADPVPVPVQTPKPQSPRARHRQSTRNRRQRGSRFAPAW